MQHPDVHQQWQCASDDYDEERYIRIAGFGTCSTPEYARLLMEWDSQR